jgi:16S rRNA (uracil1498-N3)-methyltransferase
MSQANIRLYVDQPLGPGQPVAVEEGQANYLFNVMRLVAGDPVLLFNGVDGEWLAHVEQSAKRRGVLLCQTQTAPLRLPPDLWLIFAPIKKARADFIVEKAVELGAARIVPVQTRFTNERLRQDKLQSHAIEAAEQCRATFVPPVADLIPLDRLLSTWDPARNLFWCDEALTTPTPLTGTKNTPSAILIGPEGGFAPGEQATLRALPHITPLSLGPRILRADTAAVAALTLWQAALGDWT